MRFAPRFSLRVLLALVSLLCVWLGWRVSVIHNVEHHVRAIRVAGGAVEYPVKIIGFASPGGPIVESRRRRSYFEKILFGYREEDLPRFVSFGVVRSSAGGVDPKLVDDAFLSRLAPHIAALPSVTELDLSSTSVTTDSIGTLADLGAIDSLWLEDTRLTAEDLRRLLREVQLKELQLGGFDLPEEQLEDLQADFPDCDIQNY